MKTKAKEKKAYKDFQDRVSMPGEPRKLTEEAIKKLKKEGAYLIPPVRNGRWYFYTRF